MQESFLRSPNTLADLGMAPCTGCVTLGSCPLLSGSGYHHQCSEGRGSDVPLGLPHLLHLTVVSSAL